MDERTNDFLDDAYFLWVNQDCPMPVKAQESLSTGKYDSAIGLVIVVITIAFVIGLTR